LVYGYLKHIHGPLWDLWTPGRAGLNECEASGKQVSVKPPKHLAQQKLVKQGLGLFVYISMFPYAYELKSKFQLEEEGIGIIFFVGF